jgi:branched-chain amino acid transport system permease protein
MGELAAPAPTTRRLNSYQIAQIVIGVLFGALVIWRLYTVLNVDKLYGLDTWVRFAISGIILGSVYALIAIGYTLVYGILRMINFAHGEVFMVGCFVGYFVLEGLGAIIVDPATETSFINSSDWAAIFSVFLAFVVGAIVSMILGYSIEQIAYRPLRKAPRLIPLISAIGVSLFLQNAFQLIFGPQRRSYANPDFFDRDTPIIDLVFEGKNVFIGRTGVFTFVLAITILVVLYVVVQRTRLGRAMRAVAEDKQTAALMGINVDRVISQTFMLSGALAGAAGVMWGIHYGQFYFYTGFIPGIKAFTSAVLGGIGNLPGALLGAVFLGLIESVGPAALNIDFQLKDVIAFSLLVLVLIFRPSGILGEVLTEEKV